MTEHSLTLEVLGADGVLLKVEQVSSINVRMQDGKLVGIRPGHAPLVGTAAADEIQFISNGESRSHRVSAGILTIRDNLVRILTTGSRSQADSG